MFTPKELTEQAFKLYQKLTELSKKKGIRANQEKYFLGLASRAFKRYERRLMKWLSSFNAAVTPTEGARIRKGSP